MASETAQRHVTEIVERDIREMETLILVTNKVKEGSRQVAELTTDTGYRFAFAGKLNDEWTLFDSSVFIVRFLQNNIKMKSKNH